MKIHFIGVEYMKALITGFDPFGGESINPAFEAVKLMKDQIGVCEIIKLEIPTVFGKSLDRIKKKIDEIDPDIIICVGQAGGRANISIEQVGINLDEARIADNEGNQPSGSKIKEDGKNAYFSNLPSKAILKHLHDNKIPSSLSYTAGTYVCNHVLYGLMYMIEEKYTDKRGGFVHVPFIASQVINKASTASMSLNLIVEALEKIVEATIDNKTDIKYIVGETH